MKVHLRTCPHVIHSANAYKRPPYAILGNRRTAVTEAEKNVFAQSLPVHLFMYIYIYPRATVCTRTNVYMPVCLRARP